MQNVDRDGIRPLIQGRLLAAWMMVMSSAAHLVIVSAILSVRAGLQ
jgi:hypothetical protein